MQSNPTDIKIPPSPQPSLDSGVDSNGVSDAEVFMNPLILEGLNNTPNNIPISTLAYGSKTDITAIAYGGNTLGQTLSFQSARIARLQRGVPKMRRGTLVTAMPRTVSQTIYVRDPAQTLQNRVLSPGSAGQSASGLPTTGTCNRPNPVSGAVNRYMTEYPTLIQPAK